jgi:hypothetical protein
MKKQPILCTSSRHVHWSIDALVPLLENWLFDVFYERAMALGGRTRPRRRSSTTPDFKNKEVFETMKQFTKRPIQGLLNHSESFERFRMVDKKLVSTRDTAPSVSSGLKRQP